MPIIRSNQRLNIRIKIYDDDKACAREGAINRGGIERVRFRASSLINEPASLPKTDFRFLSARDPPPPCVGEKYFVLGKEEEASGTCVFLGNLEVGLPAKMISTILRLPFPLHPFPVYPSLHPSFSLWKTLVPRIFGTLTPFPLSLSMQINPLDLNRAYS